MNVEWHTNHKLCRNATLEQRVEWHLEHAQACACREMPASVVAELRRREQVAARG